MSTPLALVTVTFSRPIAGSELMAAVKELSHSGDDYRGTSFRVMQGFDNGEVFTIGQSSPSRYDRLLVAPSRGQQEVRLDELYDKVDVMSYDWPVRNVLSICYDDSVVVKAIRDFAQKLKQCFGDPSEQTTDSSVWPQEVTVCALCERIVTRLSFEGVACSQDGNNPPTTMVKVVPATS